MFDVSHMGQLLIKGSGRVDFLESLIVGDIASLKPGEGRLSVFTTEEGGILDDTIVTKKDDHLFVVVNAACFDKDLAHIQSQLDKFPGEVHVEVSNNALLALQGPLSSDVLQPLVPVNLSKLHFMSSIDTTITSSHHPAIITRCGYTGEDGFEISVSPEAAPQVAEQLLKSEIVQLAGLAARDTLRIEAGLCLYGHDIDESTTPIEAGLGWCVGKRRTGYPGADVIQEQIKNGTTRSRIGILVSTGAPAREGSEIFLGEKKIGVVTSGTFSPTLGKPVAMGYVASEAKQPGTGVDVIVREKRGTAIVSRIPFVKAGYYKGV